MIWPARSVGPAWWLRSAAVPFGGGCIRMLSGPGIHRSWIFPRDPNCAEKAGRLLDLYAREWQWKALKDDEFVISADEKTSIQARRRKHPTRTCRPRTAMRAEHEYFVAEPGPTLPHWTCITPEFLAVARPRTKAAQIWPAPKRLIAERWWPITQSATPSPRPAPRALCPAARRG